jgi:ornithine carbamoyltransferase
MKDYLAVADYPAEDLQSILDTAVELKTEWKKNGNQPIFKDKVLAMVFQKPSLRTRVSFDMAMRHLGGDALYLSPAEIGLGKRESIADVARVLSGYVDAVMARVFDHEHILELAKWSKIPVINGLSDYNHPCQAAADALTIQENFGSLKGLKVTYLGDGNNVAVSLMHICAKLGADFTIGYPEGYGIDPDAVTLGEKFAGESGSSIYQLNDPQQAVAGAQVIYTDTWVSMGQDQEAARRKEVFPPFQVNQTLLEQAEKDAIVLHCLPAHRGDEITDEVADGPNSRLFPQAHNRLHAQKAILVKLLS